MARARKVNPAHPPVHDWNRQGWIVALHAAMKPHQPGTMRLVRIEHERWCDSFTNPGRHCNCWPTVTLAPVEPEAEAAD